MKKIIKDFIKACDLCLNNSIYKPRDGFVSWNKVGEYKINLDCINQSYSILYNWIPVIEEETYDKFIVKVEAKLQTLSTVNALNSWY